LSSILPVSTIFSILPICSRQSCFVILLKF
jgi:hypothetical protein